MFRFTPTPFFLLLFWLVALSPAVSISQSQSDRPNIIFILADDLGYADVGCYGQTKIQTPYIDQLAREGMLFTQAYAGSSVCAPSRCSLLTGKHNGRNRVRDNVPHGVYLRPDDFTVAELLKQAGYRTGGVGKWGLGNPGTWGVPNRQGFDYWYGHYDQDQAHFYYPDHLWENDEVVLLRQNKAEKKGAYTHDLFTQKALQFINTSKDSPFFLYVAFTLPHFSDYPKKDPNVYIVPSDEPYSQQPWTQTAKNYASMVTRMDHSVGLIKKRIEELGLSENTLIVFASDNGPYTDVPEPMEFFKSNGKFRGGKRSFYEGGIRVPFIANWKGVIQPGKVSDTPIAFWDMLPTFAEMTGNPTKLDTDGLSLLPLLNGKSHLNSDRVFYWDYGHTRDEFEQAVRKGRYKGLQFTTPDGKQRFELYDLVKDPEEKNNLAISLPEIVKDLKKEMQASFTYSEDYDPKKKR